MDRYLRQFRCLELMPVRWQLGGDAEHRECAVLHEIGADSGLFQVDAPAAPGTAISIRLPDGQVEGVVASCVPEEGGYILEVRIDARQQWLEGSYRPSVLIPIDGMELPIAS